MKKLLIAMAMMSAMAMAQTSSGTGTDQSSSSGAGSSSATQSGSTSTSGDTQSSTQEAPAHKGHKQSASSDASAMPESDKAAGKSKTVTGCLHKDGENYWLKTKSTKYHVMSSQDLSAHDGHEVKVSGTAPV